MVVKVGMILVIGVYLLVVCVFLIGDVMNCNLMIKMGNCNYWMVMLLFVELVCSGVFDLLLVFMCSELLMNVIDVYCVFDVCELGWMKVKLML